MCIMKDGYLWDNVAITLKLINGKIYSHENDFLGEKHHKTITLICQQ